MRWSHGWLVERRGGRCWVWRTWGVSGRRSGRCGGRIRGVRNLLRLRGWRGVSSCVSGLVLLVFSCADLTASSSFLLASSSSEVKSPFHSPVQTLFVSSCSAISSSNGVISGFQKSFDSIKLLSQHPITTQPPTSLKFATLAAFTLPTTNV